MSDAFRRVYQDLAEHGRNYADPDRAIAVARRRRMNLTVGVSACAGVLAVVTAAGVVMQPFGEVGPTTPGSTASGRPAGLAPPAVDPLAPAPALPSTGVGHATLVYATCAAGCAPRLLLPDGQQFTLPVASPIGVALSPDGRWLGYPDASRYLVRDLKGGQVLSIEPKSTGGRVTGRAWAPDSGWLLLDESASAEGGEFVLVRLSSGTQRRIPGSPTEVIGVMRGGEPLSIPRRRDQTRLTTLTVTAGLAGTSPPVTVEVGDRIGPDETIDRSGMLYPSRDDSRLRVVVTTMDGDRPTRVLDLDRSGRVHSEQQVPMDSGRWYVIGSDGERIFLGRQVNLSSDGPRTIVLSMDGLNLREVATLPQDAIVVMPGGRTG
ncbi:hypothetical protein [Micromonospora sp. NPDC049204]|uniref:hypothetical protein n=1 Tax=Micromonospora sp. NPDC049204 TaxID=3154351 RepID=UPI0033F82606